MALPRLSRLKDSKQISSMMRSRPRSSDDYFGIWIDRGSKDKSLYAVIVPTRVAAKATERNKIKRVTYEALNKIVGTGGTGYSCLIMVRKRVSSPEDVRRHLLVLLRESGILTKE